MSSDFSNGNCKGGHHGSSSQIADEEDEDGDGIISLGKMKWFFELNEKQTNETQKGDIPIVIEDVSSDEAHDIGEIISEAKMKHESANSSHACIDSSFTESNHDLKDISSKKCDSLLGKRKHHESTISAELLSSLGQNRDIMNFNLTQK